MRGRRSKAFSCGRIGQCLRGLGHRVCRSGTMLRGIANPALIGWRREDSNRAAERSGWRPLGPGKSGWMLREGGDIERGVSLRNELGGRTVRRPLFHNLEDLCYSSVSRSLFKCSMSALSLGLPVASLSFIKSSKLMKGMSTLLSTTTSRHL